MLVVSIAYGGFRWRVRAIEAHRQQLETQVTERTRELSAKTEELTKSNKQLEIAKKAAEVANRAKSAFLSNMSHELRTPLNAILGFAQLTVHTPQLPSEAEDNLATIQRSGNHLLTLINQVLDFSKIDAGRITLNEKTFDLHQMLQELHDMFSLKAQRKGLFLSIDTAHDVPQYVCTDEVKLRQVLINVVSNAMKFTQEGGVTIEVTNVTNVEEEEEQSSTINLQFSITDTGAGIAPEEMAHLFEAFSQTETGRQAQEGTGLGLPISRKFVQLMGGDITVTSDAGRGTTFRFALQVTVVEDADVESPPLIRRAIALEPDQPRYRLLIVDDKPDNRALLVKLLTPFRFELREAANGQETIGIWNAWKPHLIWMDLRMPVMGGYEATQHIRQAEKNLPSQDGNQGTIIIVLSASSLEEERTVALSNGCQDFLRKPFHESDIFAMMQTHLGVRFVYDDTGETLSPQKRPMPLELDDLPSALAALPSELFSQLEQAAINCDIDPIEHVITNIRGYNLSLAETLTSFVEEYKFTEIVTAIQHSKTL